MSLLLDQALKLPISERIRLADALYNSVGGSPGSTPLTDAQVAELERRLEDHRLHPEAGIPWKTVLEDFMQRRVAIGDKH